MYHHIGLGDHIICNGLVNYLSNKYKKIYLPVNKVLANQINYLYSENSKIEILPLEVNLDDEEILVNNYSIELQLPILKVGFKYMENKNIPFYKSFYKQLGLNYKNSYKFFYCPTNEEKENILYSKLLQKFNIKTNEFKLVHDEASDEAYQLKVESKLKSVSLSKEHDIFKNIFFYKKLIFHASEIHCVNSSFAHLIDRIETTGKLFYHNIRGSKLMFNKKWSNVEY